MTFQALNVFWSLCVYTVINIKTLFSVSLSTSEQSIFEEEFKYLIVTSPLFNGTPQLEQSEELVSSTRHNDATVLNTATCMTQRLLYFACLGMIISIYLGVYMNLVTPLLSCFICLSICYFVYRHDKHTQIRTIHASALDSMHKIILLSQESDVTLYHLFRSSSHDQSQLQKLGHFLSQHFETYIDIVHQLQPLIDAHNLSRLRDMYNVKDEIPSTLLEFDSSEFKEEDIEMIYSFVIWKRREYLLHLLALDVMSNNKSAHYGKIWRQAIRVNQALEKEYKEFNQDLVALLTMHENDHEERAAIEQTVITDERTLTMLHKLDSAENLIKDIQATLFLCKQDTKPMSSGRVSNFNLESLSKRFQHIDMNIKALSNQWESLHHLLDIEISRTESLPSPPTSPKDETMQRSHSFRYGTIQHNYTQSRLRRIQSLKIDNNNRRI